MSWQAAVLMIEKMVSEGTFTPSLESDRGYTVVPGLFNNLDEDRVGIEPQVGVGLDDIVQLADGADSEVVVQVWPPGLLPMLSMRPTS